MAKQKDVTFGVRLDKTGFTKGMNQAENELKQLDTKSKKTLGGITAGLGKVKSGIGSYFKNLGAAIASPLGAALGAGAVVTAITAGLTKSFNSAFEKVNIEKKLQAQLNKAGKGLKFDGLQSLAGKMETAFNIDGEEIQAGFTKMLRAGLSPEQIDKGLGVLAADMARATGKTFEETADALARAANGDVRRLKEYGIHMDSSGNVAKDGQSAINALQGKYGGQAGTLAKDDSPMVAMTIALGNLQETIGEALIPILVPAMNALTDALRWLSESNFFSNIAGFLQSEWEKFSEIIKAFMNGEWVELLWQLIKFVFKRLFAMIKLVATGVLPWLVKTLMKVLMRLAQAFIEIMRDVLGFLPKKIQDFLGLDLNMKNPFEELANNMDSGIGDFGNALGEFGESYVETNKAMTKELKEANSTHGEVAEETAKQSSQMKEASELYKQSSLNGMVTQTAIARAQVKQNEKLQKEQAKQQSEATKAQAKKMNDEAKNMMMLAKEMEKSGNVAGARQMQSRAKMLTARAKSFGKSGSGSPGVLAKSMHSPLGASPQAASGGAMPPPPVLNQGKIMGDISSFSAEEIVAGKANVQSYYNQYLNEMKQWAQAGAQKQQLNVRLYAPSGLHGSQVR